MSNILVTKNHKAINNQFSRRLNIVAKDLFEVELARSAKESFQIITVEFCRLQ